jgi:hypothetical protein
LLEGMGRGMAEGSTLKPKVWWSQAIRTSMNLQIFLYIATESDWPELTTTHKHTMKDGW